MLFTRTHQNHSRAQSFFSDCGCNCFFLPGQTPNRRGGGEPSGGGRRRKKLGPSVDADHGAVQPGEARTLAVGGNPVRFFFFYMFVIHANDAHLLHVFPRCSLIVSAHDGKNIRRYPNKVTDFYCVGNPVGGRWSPPHSIAQLELWVPVLGFYGMSHILICDKSIKVYQGADSLLAPSI